MAEKLFKNEMPDIPHQDDKWSNADTLGSKIEKAFTRFVQRVVLWGYEFFAELMVQIFDASMKILKPGMMRMFSPMLDEITKNQAVPQNIKDMIERVKMEKGEAGVIGVTVIAMMAINQLVSGALAPIADLITQSVNKISLTSNPPPTIVAEWVARQQITDEFALDLFKRSGFDRTTLNQFVQSAYRPPTINETIEFWRRGLIDESVAGQLIKRNAVWPEYANTYKDFFYITPPINDLIRFMVREAFSESVVEKFGYDEDYPTDINKFLPRVGLSEDWGKRYWRAHWMLPSPTQAYEMLHRGLITPDDLATLLKTSDYPVFWRDKLMKISYNLYTRVDVRRLLQAGILSEEEAYEAYLEMGYNDKKARNLTDFAVKGISQDEKDLTKTDILNLYEEGLTDRSSTQANLVKMGYDQSEAEEILQLSDVAIAKAARTDAINYVKEKFQARAIDESQARNELAVAGLKEQSIQRYMMAWKRINENDIAIPSKADIKGWFINDYIDEARLRDYLKRLKYGQEEIDIYVKDFSAQKEASTNA